MPRSRKPGKSQKSRNRARRERRSRRGAWHMLVEWIRVSFDAPPGAGVGAEAEARVETWRYLPHLLIAAFVARAAVALIGDFRLNSDEIMQYLESAHYLAFGSGILHWEFVHGARSWLVPGFVAGILLALDAVGLARPAIYVPAVEFAFCAVSLVIPWSMYRIGQHIGGETAARLALVFGCFWYELVVMAHKPMQEFVSTALLFAGLVLLLGARPARLHMAFAGGVVLALAAALRMQYAPVALLLMVLRSVSLSRAQLLSLWGGGGAVVVAVGVLEWVSWGAPYHSYVLNYIANISGAFGPAAVHVSPWRLLGQLAAAGGGAALIAFALGARIGGATRLLLLLSALVLILHMLPAHKEYRYLFPLIPCWLVLLAAVLARAPVAWRRGVPAAVLVYGAVALANVFPWQSWVHSAMGGYRQMHYVRNPEPLFAVAKFLRDNEQVQGVLDLAVPYHASGGYYHLHRNVPLYDDSTLPQNTPLANLVTHVVADARKNPRIPGFREVFAAGHLRVLQREGKAELVRWRDYVVRPTDYMNRRIAHALRRFQGTSLAWFFAENYWEKPPPRVNFTE